MVGEIELFIKMQKTTLRNKEKETVTLIVNQVNSCVHCKSAYAVIGKINESEYKGSLLPYFQINSKFFFL